MAAGAGFRANSLEADIASLLPLRSFTPDAASLEQVVQTARCDYCIFWELNAESGQLVHAGAFNQPNKLNAMRKSKDYVFTPGIGNVGRVFSQKMPEMYPDVTRVTEAEFVRRQLACNHGIRSICLVPFENGVLEYGSTQVWDTPPQFEPHLQY